MVKANIVREQDVIPMLYKEFKRGFGIRIVHSQNPKAPSKNLSISVPVTSIFPPTPSTGSRTPAIR